ncbi:MAG: hypothetical protein ACAH80_11180 [Alphaproteobacteria bacterium]
MAKTDNDLVIKLPFRVGLWMVRADEQRGILDVKMERAALKKAIENVALFHVSSGFVRTTLAKTLAHQDDWTDWAHDIETVLSDCPVGLEMVRAQGGEEDLKLYRAVLMQAAICVAEAFQEETPKPKAPDYGPPLPRSANDMGIPDNISGNEKKALGELRAVLWK